MSVLLDGAVDIVPEVNATEVRFVFAPLVANPVMAPPNVKLPEPVTVPDNVSPLTVPVPLTDVTVPTEVEPPKLILDPFIVIELLAN